MKMGVTPTLKKEMLLVKINFISYHIIMLFVDPLSKSIKTTYGDM